MPTRYCLRLFSVPIAMCATALLFAASTESSVPTRLGPSSTAVAASPHLLFENLNFQVSDAKSKAPKKGATVRIDFDSGNGTVRTTDPGGFCNFGVLAPRTYRFVVTLPSYDTADGEVRVENSPVTLQVKLRQSLR